MKNIHGFILLSAVLIGLLLLTGCQTDSVSAGPVSWIDAPHNGSSYDMQAIQVISHSNDPGGLAQVEISANGKVLETQPASGTFAQTTVTWYPDGPGNYLLHVRAQNTAGAWGGFAEANVLIGGGTPTLVPSITPTGVIPSFTPTPPTVKSGLSFKANKSTSQFYYGSCGTNNVTIQAYISDKSMVKDVMLFLNLKDQQSGTSVGWDGGQDMDAAGNGWFQRTINSSSLPKYNSFANSWVLYQFVATGNDGSVLAKSPVYSDIALSGCAAPPVRIEPPAQGITPVRKAPPVVTVPTKTLIPGPK